LRPRALAATAAVCLLAGCAKGRLPESFALPAAGVPGGAAAQGLSFPRPPEPAELEIDHERRPALLTTVGPWQWRGRIPAGARLHGGVQLVPGAWRVVHGLRAWVVAHSGGEREVVDAVSAKDGQNPRWLDFTADLSRYAGREVTLQFFAAIKDLPPEHRGSNLVAWAPVVLSSTQEEREGEERPNVLFILVDTLRRDHLTPYGYRRETTPEIARWLAAPGTVVEEAYSQAPWTLPSVISFFTGRAPGELLGSQLGAYGLPEGVPTLAERLAAEGYETGGFFANPTLHAGGGFNRGFRTFYAPPADISWMSHHADELNARVRPWLEGHQRRPFFLYVHYVDPHDPYDNPEIVDRRTPFDPGYTGRVEGTWIHGIYMGRLPLDDPQRDLFHIQALYDTEIHYVDRFIGELLSTLDPEVLARTLVVLTADHGEELYDHGGWKHGQTLYEEQIHVPLIFRWDGHIPAGRRLAGTVRLLDLMPTLVAAGGGKADPAWQGIDLLPALTGERPLPRRPAFAQHLSGGPMRAAAVLARQKLILFNPREPFEPNDPLQDYLWRKDLGRLRRVELYDLARDPGERRNLAGGNPERAHLLEPAIHYRLDAQLAGLRVFVEGTPPGSRLAAKIVFERAPARWVPYFMAPGDRAQLTGTRLDVELLGDEIEKGLRVEGDFGRILSVQAALDGQPLPPDRIRIGGGRPYTGGPIPERALLSPVETASPPGGGLKLWLHQGRAVNRRTEANPETERALRALGYIQ